MSNDLGISVKASVNLDDLNQELEKTAQKFSQMTGNIGQGGQLKIDTGKFVEQMNSCNAAMAALHAKIAEQKKLGIDTSEAESKLKSFTQIQSDASKALFGQGSTTGSAGGKTPGEAAQQRMRDEIEKTRQAFKRYYREISESEADALNRATKNLRSGQSPLAAYVSSGSFAELLDNQSGSASDIQGRRRAIDRIMQNAGIGQGGAAGAGGVPMSSRAASFAGMLGGMAGSMAAGGDGGIASTGGSLIGTGVGALIGGPLGAVAGAFLSPLLGGIGKMVDSGVKDAQDEAIGVADLRASLGALSNDFAGLSGIVKTAGQGLGVVSTEVTQLAKRFAKDAGLRPEDGDEIGEEIRNAIGMARSFGSNPAGMASFFAQMRVSGVTRSADENRQLGAIISESIVRGGNISKADEVLQAVGAFSSMMARQTLTAPNAEGFASVLAALTQGKGPGLDVQGAANLLNQMDAGYKGNNSEAAQNFKLGIYQNSFGRNFSALDVDLVNQQGVFGNAKTGLKSARDFAERMGDKETVRRLDETMANPNAETMNGILALQELKRRTGNDSTMYRKSGVGLFGGNEAMFMAFDQAMSDPMKLGQLKAIGDMPARNQALAAQIMFEQDQTKLKGLAAQLIKGEGLKGKLAESDIATLQTQMAGGDQEALRKSLLAIAKGAAMTDSGNDLRDKVADVKQAIIDLSGKLLPAVDAVRDAVLFAAGKDSDAFKKSQEKAALAPYQAKVDAALKAVNDAEPPGGGDFAKESDRANHQAKLKEYNAALEEYKAAQAAYRGQNNKPGFGESGQLPAYLGPGMADFPMPTGKYRKPRPGMKLTDSEQAYLSETDKLIGAPKGTSAAQIQVESGNDPEAVSPEGAWGLGQIMPRERAVIEGRMGRKIVTRMDMLEAHRLMMQENKNKFGNVPDALRAYNGSWDRRRWNNKETAGYVPDIEATRRINAGANDTAESKMDSGLGHSAFAGSYNDKIPQDGQKNMLGGGRYSFEPLNISLTGNFTAAGMQPIQMVQTHVSKPVPSGTQ